MSEFGTITRIAKRLESGDRDAASDLWNIFSPNLLRLVNQRLDQRIRRRVDPEDVLQSAFLSFCRALEDAAYCLDNRGDIFNFLCTIAVRKMLNVAKSNSRDRRDYRKEAVVDDDGWIDLQRLATSEPTPLEKLVFAEEIERLFAALPSDELRQIARMRFEGMTNAEIAASLDRTPRTIERKLDRIRQALQTAAQP